jgi:DNA primase
MNSASEEIRARTNIVDIIGEYVRLTKAGANYRALCPFHHEKSPSFIVSEEKQIWHCFGCQKGGDIFGFVMEIESVEFKEALKILAEKSGVDLSKYSYAKSTAPDSRPKTLEILELATKFYEIQLWKGAGKEKILDYLYKRGLKKESIREFRLGYAPRGWRNLLEFLMKRGYKTEDILRTGLLVQKSNDNSISNSPDIQNSKFYDRFRERIMFPIFDTMSHVIGFSARVAPGGDESQAKYVNTPETEVYHKSRVLYGIDKAKEDIKKAKNILVVEGNMDVIAAHQAGIKNTVAVSGTAFTPEQLDTIKRYTNNIKMLYDMDSAGQEAALRSSLLCFQKDMDVSIVKLPEAKDAAELAEKNPEKLKEAIRKPIGAMQYFFDNAFSRYNRNNVADKKSIAQKMLVIIQSFKNAIEQSHWIRKLAEKLEVEEKALLDLLKKDSRRIGKRESAAPEDKKELIPQNREETLKEKIMGLALAYSEIWEKEIADPEIAVQFQNNYLYTLLKDNGEKNNFEFEKLLNSFEGGKVKDSLQKLYFESRFVLGEEIKERTLEEARNLLAEYKNTLAKEFQKDRLKLILLDIKKAEENGDKESLRLLVSEFSKLSKEFK